MNHTPGIGRRFGALILGLFDFVARIALLVCIAWLCTSTVAVLFLVELACDGPPWPFRSSFYEYPSLTVDEGLRQVQENHTGLFFTPGIWVNSHGVIIAVIFFGIISLIVLAFVYDYLRWGDTPIEERDKKNEISPHVIH